MTDQSPKLSVGMRITMKRVLGIIQEFRELQSDLPLRTASIFSYVAANPGVSMTELQERTDTRQSTCSHIIATLSEWEEYGKPGFGLVWTEEDPHERRRKLVHLTEKGEELAAQLADYAR